MRGRFRVLAFALLAGIAAAPAFAQGEPSGGSLETSLVDPFFSIYFLRYHYDLAQNDSLIFGIYYLRAEKTFSGVSYSGSYSGLGPLLGYRRMVWKKLYCEDQLLPLFAIYYSSGSGSTVSGFELWDELHIGYRFDFTIGPARLFLNAQGIVGFNLLKTNEPEAFDTVETFDPAFHFPNFYVLPNILLGIRL